MFLPVLLLSAALAAPAAAIAPEADRQLTEGLDGLFRMDYDRAELAVRAAAQADPEHPYPALGLAAVAWARFIYQEDQSDDALLAPFEDRVRAAGESAERWLRARPGDPEGLLALGAAYGLSSRLALMRKEWLSGYWNGRKAISLARAASKAAPADLDAQLAMGMYDYYSDLYPRFIGVLARVVLRGDRVRAIGTLTRISEGGHYARNPAKVLLIEIYTEDPYGAKDPAKALALARELRAQFPESPLMRWGELLALYAGSRFDEASAGARELVAAARKGSDRVHEAKGLVLQGLAEWSAGRSDAALAALDEASAVELHGRPCRWAVWARIKAGELHDARGEREAALRRYREAADAPQPESWGLRKLAKAGLARPYRGGAPAFVTPP